MFHRLRRRPSPATAIAAVALFVALSGTAVAQSDIIITSPDQLATNVVTGPKIAPNSIAGIDIANGVVSDNDLDDPQLKVRGLAGGGQLEDSDGKSVRTSLGTYQVTFDTKSLNSTDGDTGHTLLTDNCAFTATARNRLAMMSVDGPSAATPNTVTVRAAFPGNTGLIRSVDSQFDILASC
jgi:hypothetical protein